jgi:hypothetical protein
LNVEKLNSILKKKLNLVDLDCQAISEKEECSSNTSSIDTEGSKKYRKTSMCENIRMKSKKRRKIEFCDCIYCY